MRRAKESVRAAMLKATQESLVESQRKRREGGARGEVAVSSTEPLEEAILRRLTELGFDRPLRAAFSRLHDTNGRNPPHAHALFDGDTSIEDMSGGERAVRELTRAALALQVFFLNIYLHYRFLLCF